jgi:hypothetical protein
MSSRTQEKRSAGPIPPGQLAAARVDLENQQARKVAVGHDEISARRIDGEVAGKTDHRALVADVLQPACCAIYGEDGNAVVVPGGRNSAFCSIR